MSHLSFNWCIPMNAKLTKMIAFAFALAIFASAASPPANAQGIAGETVVSRGISFQTGLLPGISTNFNTGSIDSDIDNSLSSIQPSATSGSLSERASLVAAYRARQRARRARALELRRKINQSQSAYSYNPGYHLPPSIHDYTFNDTQGGYAIGPNLRRHAYQTLGR